jgi:hypothetical protein
VPVAVQRAYSDLLVTPDGCRAPSEARVTREEALHDLDVLARIFARGYAGYELAGTEAEWAQVFAEARDALPAEPMSALEFRDFLLARFAFLADGHVAFWAYVDGRRFARSTGGHVFAHVSAVRFDRRDGELVDDEGRVLIACDGRPAAEVVRPFLEGDARVRFAPVVRSRATVTRVDCTLRSPTEETVTESIPLHRIALSDGRGPSFERRSVFEERGAASFPWLRLRTLFPNRGGALEDFVASAAEVRDAPVLVLDMRGVGGGADRYLVRWFRELTSETIHYWQTDALSSEVTLQGALTFWGCVRAGLSTDAGGDAWLEERIRRGRRELDEAMAQRGEFRARDRQHLAIEGRAPRPFAGRLVLLVDRGCASACETSVLLARQLPGTLVVGENTEGTMKVGELRSYRLPESGVWLSAGTRVHTDTSVPGGFPEGNGYEPDVWLDTDEVDARVTELVRCLSDAACAAALPAR